MAFVKVHALIASNVHSHRRIIAFDSLLKSIKSQTIAPLTVFISISYDKNLEEKVNNLFHKYEDLNLVVTKYIGKIPQFIHYLYMIEKLKRIEHDWVIFSNDDDEWSSNRTELFMKSIHEALNNKIINFMDFAVHLPRHLEDEVLREQTSHNHIEISIKASSLISFLEKTSTETLSHSFADVFFFSFITKYKNVYTPADLPGDCWLYIWKRTEESKSLLCASDAEKLTDKCIKYLVGAQKKPLLKISSHIPIIYTFCSDIQVLKASILRSDEETFEIAFNRISHIEGFDKEIIKELFQFVIVPYWKETRIFCYLDCL